MTDIPPISTDPTVRDSVTGAALPSIQLAAPEVTVAEPELGPQVRDFNDTFSIDDALAAERVRLQDDPGRPVPPHGSGPASYKARTPFLSFLTTDAAGETQHVESPVSEVKIVVAGAGGPSPVPPPAALVVAADRAAPSTIEKLMAFPERLLVEGKVTVEHFDPILLRMAKNGETAFEAKLMLGHAAAKRELLWVIHNLIAHPLAEITHWLGFIVPPLRRFGLWFHDLTIPQHAEGTGRG